MTVANFSALAIVTSAVIYLVAMIAHAAEWGAARSAVPAKAGVGAASAKGGGVAVLDRGSDAADADRIKATVQAIRVDMFARMGVALTMVAFVAHLTGVVSRGIAAGRMPWGNMYEFVTAASLVVVGAYLLGVWRMGLRWLGLPVTLVVAILNGLAATVFYVAIGPLVPSLHSIWFVIHICAAVVAGAAFNIGGLAAILYLIKFRAERLDKPMGYLAKLPSAEAIDRLSYRFIMFGFPIWTFTIAAGAVWAEFAWGRYWGWDPKETWSLVTWVVYAGYLHARATAGWRGTRAAWLAVLGLVLFWFNFIGVNLLVSGLHSYAGI